MRLSFAASKPVLSRAVELILVGAALPGASDLYTAPGVSQQDY